MAKKKPGPMTNAERQAAYRARKLGTEDIESAGSVLNMVVPYKAKWTLKRLAAHSGKSMVDVLAELVQKEEDRVTKKLDPKAWTQYFDAVPPP